MAPNFAVANFTGASFPRFNELPSELRLMIWQYSLPGPRIVYLQRKPLAPYGYLPIS